MELNKEEYIAIFGKEAWAAESRRRAAKKYYHSKKGQERYKKWRDDNKEKRRETSKKYYEENKERIRVKNETRKEEIKEYNKQYNLQKKNQISAHKKEYYKTIKEDKKKYNKSYRDTQNGKAAHMVGDYKKEDIKNNRKGFNLERNWIINHIFNSSCIYCGDTNWKHLGCDRVDNNLPHTPENCVCSCGICNIERQGKKMSVEEFIEYRKIHPRDVDFKPPQEIVEINGKKVIKKVG